MWYSRSSSVQSKQTELSMALFPVGKWRTIAAAAAAIAPLPLLQSRSFRSDAALEALAKASQEKVPNLLLYNYPSFSGAFSALFAHLFHSRLNLPCLSLPFSSVEPFRSSLSISLNFSASRNAPFNFIVFTLLLQGRWFVHWRTGEMLFSWFPWPERICNRVCRESVVRVSPTLDSIICVNGCLWFTMIDLSNFN